MTFWILSVLLCLVVAGFLVWPMLTHHGAEGSDENPDVVIYKAHLAEIDRDLERGVLAPDEAERTRTEVSRRLLAAARSGSETAQAAAPRASRLAAAMGAAAMIGTGLLGYAYLGAPGELDQPLDMRLAQSEILRQDRPTFAEAVEIAEALLPKGTRLPAEEMDLIEMLREAVDPAGTDAEGLRLLARNEARLGNYAAAVPAQMRLIEVLGPRAGQAEWEALAAMSVQGTFGFTTAQTQDLIQSYFDLYPAAHAITLAEMQLDYVSPETQMALNAILTNDPGHIAATYYYALLFYQTGRPDNAFELFLQLVNSRQFNDPLVQRASVLIDDAAFRAGIDYQFTPPSAAGPSAADIAAMQSLPPDEQRAAIEGMVMGLEDRLARDGGTIDDWVMLINGHAQLGNIDHAFAILTEARQLFGTMPEALSRLDALAERTGLMQ